MMMTGGWLSGTTTTTTDLFIHSTSRRNVSTSSSTYSREVMESGATKGSLPLPLYNNNNNNNNDDDSSSLPSAAESFDDNDTPSLLVQKQQRRHFQFIVSIISLILLFVSILYIMWMFETYKQNNQTSNPIWQISGEGDFYNNNSPTSSNAHLIAKCNHVREVALMYINIIDNPPCKLPVYSPFVSKTKDDKELGQCFTAHTDWNRESQSFTIKCPLPHHIPMYYTSNNYQFNNADGNRENWKLYPSEDLVAMIKTATQSSSTNAASTFKESISSFIPSMTAPISTHGASVIQTACVDTKKGVSYHNFFVQTVRNETMVQEKQEILKAWQQTLAASSHNKQQQQQQQQQQQLPSPPPPPNIHVVLIDGASRDWFYRHFPHTNEYLNEMKQMKNAPFGIYDLTNTMVLGYNSIPNMHAFITGKSVKPGETQDMLIRRIRDQSASDHTPTIWDDLKKLGYVTTIGEDAGESGVATLYGTKNQPRTFDTYPAFHVVAHRVNIDQGYYFNYNPRVCPCVGQRFMSDLVLDWTRSHMTTYSDLPNFIVSTSHEVHDTFSRQSVTLDPNVKKHLQWFVETGRLENSVVVLMADHGIHYGPIFANEEMGRFEHENPFVLLIMPNHLTTDTFKGNVNKLITLKDIYMTLKDVASFPVRSTEGKTRTDALSMLHDVIPEGRTCDDVESHPDFSTSCNSPKRRKGGNR